MFQVMQKQTRWRALALQDSPCLIEIKGNVQGSFGFVSASFAIFGVAVTQFKHMIGLVAELAIVLDCMQDASASAVH